MPAKALVTSLKFKASNIARAEEQYKMDFFSALDKIGTSMRAMEFLFCAGGGDEESFDQFMSEKGMQELSLLVIEGINDAGFLGRKLDTTKLRKLIKEGADLAMEKAEAVMSGNAATLQNTGDKISK